MSKAVVLLFLSVSLALSSCSSEAKARQRLVVTGSSTVAPLFAEIAKRFEDENHGVRIDVQTGGSTRGATDTRRGIADFGMMSRALKPEEDDLEAWSIALDGLAMIVHSTNPVAQLSVEQVQAIYRGRVTNWSEVGGQDLPIVVVHKAEGRATLELFLEFFDLENPEVEPGIVVGDNEQGIKTIAGLPGAIGYVSIGAAAYHADRGTPLKMLPHQGVPASLEAVAAGRWPMLRELILVSTATASDLAHEVIDFARSEAVHDLVHALSFVPVGL